MRRKPALFMTLLLLLVTGFLLMGAVSREAAGCSASAEDCKFEEGSMEEMMLSPFPGGLFKSILSIR